MNAKRDDNFVPALLGHSSIKETASTVRVVADNLGNINITPADSVMDAFHRIRVSNPNTQFDNQNQYNASPLYYETVLTGNGTTAFLSNESSVNLTVTTANGDKVVNQTHEYFRYQPGKSQLIIMTAVPGATKTNVRKRWGYYDTNNGIFFEDDGTGLFAVQRSSASGSPVDTRVAQANFNLDTLDGNGPSGITIDLSKANIFWFDLQWLGVGCTTFGIYSDHGIPVAAHQFHNSNSLTSVYMETANLPIRQSIENTGTSATPTSFKFICNSVITEDGGSSLQGLNSTVANGITTIPVTTRRAVLSFRPLGTFNGLTNRAAIKDVEFELVASTNDSFYEVVYNPTFTGTQPTWLSNGTNSTVEYTVHAGAGAGTLTGGIVIDSGYVVSGQGIVRGQTAGSVLSKLPLYLNTAGTNPTPLSLVCTSMNATSNVAGSFTFKEIY